MHFPDFDELLKEKARNLIRLYSFEIDLVLEQGLYCLNERWFYDWEATPRSHEEAILESILKSLQAEELPSYEDPQRPPSEDYKSFVEFLIAFKFACQLHIVEDKLEYEELSDYFPIFREGYFDALEHNEASGGL